MKGSMGIRCRFVICCVCVIATPMVFLAWVFHSVGCAKDGAVVDVYYNDTVIKLQNSYFDCEQLRQLVEICKLVPADSERGNEIRAKLRGEAETAIALKNRQIKRGLRLGRPEHAPPPTGLTSCWLADG